MCPEAVSYTHLDVYKRQVSTLVFHNFQCFSSVNVKMDVTDTGMLAGISAALLVLKRIRERRENINAQYNLVERLFKNAEFWNYGRLG